MPAIVANGTRPSRTVCSSIPRERRVSTCRYSGYRGASTSIDSASSASSSSVAPAPPSACRAAPTPGDGQRSVSVPSAEAMRTSPPSHSLRLNPGASLSRRREALVAAAPISDEDRDRVELILGQRPLEMAELHRHVVEAPGCIARPEVPLSGCYDLDDRQPDVGPRLI